MCKKILPALSTSFARLCHAGQTELVASFARLIPDSVKDRDAFWTEIRSCITHCSEKPLGSSMIQTLDQLGALAPHGSKPDQIVVPANMIHGPWLTKHIGHDMIKDTLSFKVTLDSKFPPETIMNIMSFLSSAPVTLNRLIGGPNTLIGSRCINVIEDGGSHEEHSANKKQCR